MIHPDLTVLNFMGNSIGLAIKLKKVSIHCALIRVYSPIKSYIVHFFTNSGAFD